MANGIGAVANQQPGLQTEENPTPERRAELRQGWTDFLGSPQVQAGMIQMGVQLLQPVAPGQTGAGAFGQALGAGAEAAGRVGERERELEREERGFAAGLRKEEREEKRIAVAGRQAGAAERRAGAAETAAGRTKPTDDMAAFLLDLSRKNAAGTATAQEQQTLRILKRDPGINQLLGGIATGVPTATGTPVAGVGTKQAPAKRQLPAGAPPGSRIVTRGGQSFLLPPPPAAGT